MSLINKALMMKIAWGVIHDKDNLWASVLGGKYIKSQDHVPHVKANEKDSALWKTVCKVWPQVLEGRLSWSLRNGRCV